MVHSCKHQHHDHLKNGAISNALIVCRHALYTLGYASIIKSCRHLTITNFPFVVVDVGQCYTYQRAEHESSCIILSLILTLSTAAFCCGRHNNAIMQQITKQICAEPEFSEDLLIVLYTIKFWFFRDEKLDLRNELDDEIEIISNQIFKFLH